MSEGLAGQAASAGPRTGSCCCSCKSAISVGETRWSGPLGLPQCRTALLHCPSASWQLLYTVSVPPDSSSTLSAGAPRQLLYTVPRCLPAALPHCLSASRQLLYTVSVPPDSSSTLSPGRCVTLLLCDSSTVWLFYFQSCSPAPGVIEERGGEWGKQVGSMDEELQVRGCYNITFNCTNQETGSPLNQMHGQQLELLLTTCYCRDTGGKRTLWPSTRFNTLDNWGHKTPTQSNFHPIRKEKDRKERLKGHNPKHIQHTRLQYIYECRSTVVLTV